ncbi:hypothetical protein [Rhizobium lusitanum]|uniref:hypothetical protein n=1 Tax=Rhizobium lusitanum TaxID=293958 RepID=UPI001956C7B2|nr:hypothetical protein [Rhizobium lusitanum]MBM7045215.1 hypothetical protein [Rhizobium lusitanum]
MGAPRVSQGAFEKFLFIALFTLVLISLLLGLAGIVFGWSDVTPRLLNTSSALAGLASLAQLRLSGWFDLFTELYSDTEKFPYGPPSFEMRRYYKVDHPEQPIRSWFRRQLFFEYRTGAVLAVMSFLIWILAAWF